MVTVTKRTSLVSAAPISFIVTLLGLMSFGSGCKVTSQDLETWKGTVKGPGKIVAVMLADKYSFDLRAQAALTLVEMERQDVDGLAELQRGIQQIGEQDRHEIVKRVTPGLEQLLQAKPTPTKAGQGETTGPLPSQIRAKDAAFVLVPHADEESRKRLTDAVVKWLAEDFSGRSLVGNYSAEQVVRSLGSPAAGKLVEALSPRMPQQAMVKTAELIGQIGDAQTKQRAGERLIAIEKEMESKEFVGWLKDRIRAQLAERAKGQKVDEAGVARVALHNQEEFITAGALSSMKYLADQPAVASRLLQIASTKANDENRRTTALLALEGKAKNEHLKALLALALDSNNPAKVRDEAFNRVGDLRNPEAIAPMWPLVQSTTDARLRWRAAELVLAVGGERIVDEVFRRLPGGEGAAYPPEELAGYAARLSQMTPVPVEAARSMLRSPNWWSRVVALRFFERKGTAADIPAVQQLASDSTPCRGEGWDAGYTVGKVAGEVVAAIKERKE